MSEQEGTISFEVGLREEILVTAQESAAHTLANNPINGEPLLAPFSVMCLSKQEAYSEKLRAALSRRKPAIRDLFDIDYALRAGIINLNNKELLALTRIKMSKPEALEIDTSQGKQLLLKQQVATDLSPVLREQDYNQFEFDAAWDKLKQIAKLL